MDWTADSTWLPSACLATLIYIYIERELSRARLCRGSVGDAYSGSHNLWHLSRAGMGFIVWGLPLPPLCLPSLSPSWWASIILPECPFSRNTPGAQAV